MKGRVYALLLLFVCAFAVCAAKGVRCEVAFPVADEAMQASRPEDKGEQVASKIPYFFFSHWYIAPLSSSAGTACEVPAACPMDAWNRLLHFFFVSDRNETSVQGGFSYFYPPAAKDYYVFALRRIVV